MNARTLVFLLMAIALDGVSARECRPVLELDPPVVDQWTAEQLARGDTVRVPFGVAVRAARSTCSFIVGFGFSSGGRVRAHVERRPFSEPLLDIPQASINRLLSGRAAPDESARFELDLVLTPRGVVKARTVNLQLRISAYAGIDPGTAKRAGQIRHRLRVRVPAFARVDVISDAGRLPLAGVSGLIDLGRMVSGQQAAARLLLASNVDVELEIRARRGELVHAEYPAYRVPYALTIDGTPVAPGDAYRGRRSPDAEVDLHVRVGRLEEVVSGSYRDAILVTIRPL
jgi:hypothetical protein